MIYLRTLGSLDLKGGDPQRTRAILARPKSIALLVYLALARPRGFHRRDSLLAMFWPESDDAHARNTLRQSLHALRTFLAPDVFETRGDHEIGLNRSALSCDAEAFEGAVVANRTTEALELYRGDLLPGFFVESAAFEQWLDSERARLRRTASSEAWQLSSRAAESGDVALAVQWARHVAAFTPDDEKSVTHLLELLAQAGDRTEAARVYSSYRNRLANEYQMEPSVRLEALATRIAANREAPAFVSAHLFASGRTRNWHSEETTRHQYEMATASPTTRLAVLPFSVLASASFTYLREGVAEMLSSTLDGTTFTQVVDQQAVRSYCGASKEDEMQQGKSLSHRFGASQFLLGSVTASGRRLRLKASLFDADGTLQTTVESKWSGEDGIFEMVDEVARRVLASRHPGPAGRVARSAAEMTTSISALKHFLEAERDFDEGRWVKAREKYDRAVCEDSSLALAWQRMSWNSFWLLQPDEARSFAEKALELVDRLSVRDAIGLRAFLAFLQGDAEEAERRYHEVLSRWPDDVQAHVGLGLLLLTLNPLRGRSADEGIDPLTYALLLDPSSIDARLMLAYLSARKQRFDELDSLLAWLPSDADYKVMIASNHSIAHRNEAEMNRLRLALEQAPDLLVHECVRYSAVIGHDFAEAQRLAAILSRSTRAPGTRATAHVLIALSHIVRGRLKESKVEFLSAYSLAPISSGVYRALGAVLPFVTSSRAELESLVRALKSWKMDGDPTTETAHLSFFVHTGVYAQLREYLLGVLHVRLGKNKSARVHAQNLLSLPGAACALELAHDLSLSIHAQIEYSEGRPGEALRLLELTRLRPPYDRVQMQSPFFSENMERYTRARLLEETGRLDEALRWYDSMCENGLHEFSYLAPSHFRRGLVHQRLANNEAARRHFTEVTRLWSDADRSLLPVVGEAARRLSQLS